MDNQQVRQALRLAACAAGQVIGQQGRLHVGLIQPALRCQVHMQQVDQFVLRKLMCFARCLPQPVAEVQKVMERRVTTEQQL